jgi:PadR family transcriptional regulator PadR
MAKQNIPLLQGTLDVMILKALSTDSMHGYGVAVWLEQCTDNVLQIEEGSLYPALHRMQRKGWLDAEWGLSDNNRRAKYYRITPAGQKHLRQESASWEQFAGAVSTVLGTRALGRTQEAT